MSLSLLFPAALAMAALLVLPILAHMARQQPKVKTPFGAMLLLRRVVKRLRRRRRLRDWLLFLLRMLLLAALVLGAAQPEWTYPDAQTEYGGSGRVVLVIDQSMSMGLEEQGKTLLAKARQGALEVLDELPASTLVGVIAFGNGAERLVPSLTNEHGRVKSRIAGLQPTYERSDLRGALLEARKLLAGEVGEVFVFTDEAGPTLMPSARHELRMLSEKGSVVIPRPIHAEKPANVAVLDAEYGDGLEGGVVRLTMSNFGMEPVEVPCEVTLPDGQNIPIFAELPAEGTSTEVITVPREARGGVGHVHCEDEALSLDDNRYFHLPRVGASRVLVVDGKPGDTPSASEVYYLERALAPWGGRQSGVLPDVITPAGLNALDPEVHRVVFLANVADPRPIAGPLTEFVRGGGGLVISSGDNMTAERYNGALGGILPALFRKPRALTAPGEPGVPLALPEVAHPMFRTFRREGRLGFQRIRSQRVMTLEPYEEGSEIKTLLEYEGGIPALVERKVGTGRVLVWTSSMDWDWSNFPLQAIFMPFIQRMTGFLGGESGTASSSSLGLVGEVVQLSLPSMNVQPVVMGPTGPVRSKMEGSQLLFTPDAPGGYEVQVEDGPALAWIAVNVDTKESDVRRGEGLAQLQQAINPDQVMRRLALGPYLLWVMLILFIGQSVLSLWGRS